MSSGPAYMAAAPACSSASRDPAAKHSSGRDTGTTARLHIPYCVADENRLGRFGLNAFQRAADDVWMGFAAIGVGRGRYGADEIFRVEHAAQHGQLVLSG